MKTWCGKKILIKEHFLILVAKFVHILINGLKNVILVLIDVNFQVVINNMHIVFWLCFLLLYSNQP